MQLLMLILVYSLFCLSRFCWQSPLTSSAHRSLKLGLADYQKFLEELAKAKKVDLAEIREKMIQCGPPGTTGTTVSFIFFSLNAHINTRKKIIFLSAILVLQVV